MNTTPPWVCRLGRLLSAPFRPGIGRDIGLVFVTLGILGLIAAMAVDYELQRQEEYSNLIDTASHLRTLSQRIALTAQRTSQGDAVAKQLLPQLDAEFEKDLLFVEQTILAHEIFRPEGSEKSLNRLKSEWQQSRSA